MGFGTDYERDIAAGLRGRPPQSGHVTEADLAPLPPVVQRYLHFAGSVGRPRVWNYRVRFRGELRNDADSRWMKIRADQQSFVDPAARLFLVKGSMFGLPFRAFHRYVGPAATFKVRLAGLLTVVNAAGPEMDQSETVTLLNDMCLLAPATLIDPRIAWDELDPLTVRATFGNAGNTVSAVLAFDDSGALVDFVSHDRSRTTDGKAYERLRWSTPVRAWGTFDGRQLPVRAEAVWREGELAFAYARFEIVGVDYNVTAD
ncbi:MAG: DUF6544 family protein [Actinomycetes bacterium]